jgi:hypothetical protein
MSAKGQIPFIGIYDGDMANKPTIEWAAAGGIATPLVAQNYQFAKLELKRDAEVKRLGDSNGQMSGYKIRQRMRTLSITLIVRVTAGAGAVAAAAVAAAAAPPDLTKIVISKVISATDTVGCNGDWIYETGAQTAFSGDDEVQITFDVHQFYTDAGVVIPVATLLALPS